jgi:hypothetical protein
MTRTLRLALLLSAALALPAAAQDNASIGVGVGLDTSELAVLQAGAGTPFAIYVPMQLKQGLRIEPSLGVFTQNVSGGGDSSVWDLGVGAFFPLKTAPSYVLSAGGRLNLTFVSQSAGTGGSASATGVALAAAVAGEWFAAPRFSLGAEGQLGFYSIGDLEAGGVTLQAGVSGLRTRGILFARFWF